MSKYKFAPATENEKIVYGAQRPGYRSKSVDENEVNEWINYMKTQGINRVVCLLSKEEELEDYYKVDLLKKYEEEFSEENVLWTPIPDYHIVNKETLKNKIIPFLRKSVKKRKPVVIHCSGGIGRTGHVLAAWLNHQKDYEKEKAIKAVEETGRNPEEAKNRNKEKFNSLFKKQ